MAELGVVRRLQRLLLMNANKANCIWIAIGFCIVGFFAGFIAAPHVVALWSTALGQFFVAPSPHELFLVRYRFAAGCATLAATAPFAAILFPRTVPTLPRHLAYLALSSLVCIALVFVFRAVCRQVAWDFTYTTLGPLPRISQFPLFTVCVTAGIATLLLAAAARLISNHLLPRPFTIHANA